MALVDRVYVLIRYKAWHDAFLLERRIAEDDTKVREEIERRYPSLKGSDYEHEVRL